MVELDGSEAECEARFEQVKELRGAGADSVRVAKDEAERDLIWRARKAAFAAMGRIAPNYYVQDSVIPRTKLAEVLGQIEDLASEHDLQVANVFHAGDGNLHPLVCYDGSKPGEAERAEELAGLIVQGVRGRGRLDHGRARRGRGQEALHAGDVRRARPRHVPAAPLRVRPGRPGQPGQGDADSAAVRRGARAVPAAPARAGRAGGAVLMAVATRVPATREELAAALGEAGEAGTPVRFRGGGTKLGWPPAAPSGAIELSTAGLTKIVEHNAGDLTAVLEAGVPLAEAQALFAKEGSGWRSIRPTRAGPRSGAWWRPGTRDRSAAATAARAISWSGCGWRCPTARSPRAAAR